MTDPTPTDALVHTARVSLRTGSIQFAAGSAAALDQVLAGWCRGCWAQEHAKRAELSATPPATDRAAIEEYFTHIDTDFCEREAATIAAIEHPAALSDTQLADAYRELNTLTRELSVQRAALARLLLAKLQASLAGPERRALSPQADREVQSLLLALTLEEAERDASMYGSRPPSTAAQADAHDDAGLPERSDAEIVARIRAELPQRRFARRVRWSVAQLERIRALAQRERTASPELTGTDTHERALTATLLEAIAENATRMSAARNAPEGLDGADPTTVAQVAYLMGVEVLVDLEQGRVTRVVIIDESLELDAEQGARAEGTLASLNPAQTFAAVRIAEQEAVWPAAEFGF